MREKERDREKQGEVKKNWRVWGTDRREDIKEIVINEIVKTKRASVRRYLSPGPRSAAAAPLDHISQEDGHNHVTSLIVAVITATAFSGRRTQRKRKRKGRRNHGQRELPVRFVRSYTLVYVKVVNRLRVTRISLASIRIAVTDLAN